MFVLLCWVRPFARFKHFELLRGSVTVSVRVFLWISKIECNGPRLPEGWWVIVWSSRLPILIRRYMFSDAWNRFKLYPSGFGTVSTNDLVPEPSRVHQAAGQHLPPILNLAPNTFLERLQHAEPSLHTSEVLSKTSTIETGTEFSTTGGHPWCHWSDRNVNR